MKILILNSFYSFNTTSIKQANLGEDALLYTQLNFISEASRNNTEVTILSKFNADISSLQNNFSKLNIKLICYETKGLLGRYIEFLKKNLYTIFIKNDYIFDVRGGDSFSDLYGKSNSIIRSIMFSVKLLFGKSKFVLLPQTIGPFYYKDSLYFAKYIIKKSSLVFTRDQKSADYVKTILPNKPVTCVTDMAFRLPYQKKQWSNNDKIKVGINASGLLAQFKNKAQYSNMSLNVDYNIFIRKLIEKFIALDNVEVHIIPHVITTRTDIEDNDLYFSKQLVDEYPQTVLSDIFTSAIEAKSYISSMDFFIGSRMHATIAAVSSEVPTVPVGYSRKFTGLYGNLDYPYVIDLQSEDDVDKVVDQCVEHFHKREEIKAAAVSANAKAQGLLDIFENELKKLFTNEA